MASDPMPIFEFNSHGRMHSLESGCHHGCVRPIMISTNEDDMPGKQASHGFDIFSRTEAEIAKMEYPIVWLNTCLPGGNESRIVLGERLGPGQTPGTVLQNVVMAEMGVADHPARWGNDDGDIGCRYH